MARLRPGSVVLVAAALVAGGCFVQEGAFYTSLDTGLVEDGVAPWATELPVGKLPAQLGDDPEPDTGSTFCRLRNLDFTEDPGGNPLPAGLFIDDQWADWGVEHIYTDDQAHPAILFDSNNPTGDDPDLGTPNAIHGGPGNEAAGTDTNTTALDNLLIIAENTVTGPDGLVTTPDDLASGGLITFAFHHPLVVISVTLIDHGDNGPPARVAVQGALGEELYSFETTVTADNGVERVLVTSSAQYVEGMVVTVWLPGSGAIGTLVVCDWGDPNEVR